MVTPRTMPGVLELLPAEQITFQRMLSTIRAAFERYGFLPIETPVMELSEVLLTKTGGDTEREVFFSQSTGSLEQGKDPDLALRFDLTVPTARYVAEHENDLAFPFRRYQIQRVYRGERPQRGRFREFYQCDIDVIDRNDLSLRYDAEVPAVIAEVFRDLAVGEFTIRINNRKVMRGLLESLGVTGDQSTMVLREVDKLDKRGREAVLGTLVGHGMTTDAAERLLTTVDSRATGPDASLAVLDALEPVREMVEGVGDLRQVIETMRSLGVPGECYGIDLSIARGLDYYTGTVYETVLDDHLEIGSICSGGRYDDLAGHYTKSKLPGVGMSIGFTRLFWQLRELGLVGASDSTVQVLVTVMDVDGVDYALDVARRLRNAGVNTEAAVEPSKLGKQLKYADRAGIRYAVIAGTDERAARTVTVRDLKTQTQVELPLEQIGAHLAGEQES